jgi:hypothetical protein
MRAGESLRGMRPHDDPVVQDVAKRIAEGKGVVPWPDWARPMGACGLVMIDKDAGTYLAYAPDHHCDNLDWLHTSAARTILDFVERGGPDEGWHALENGEGWITWLVSPREAPRDVVFPLSEMPPLD